MLVLTFMWGLALLATLGGAGGGSLPSCACS